LSVDCVFGATTIVLLRVIRDRGHGLILHPVFQAFLVDHCVGPFVAGAVTGALVEDAKVLTLLLRLKYSLIGSSLYFPVRPIDFESCYQFQIVSVIVEGFGVVCQTHIVGFLRSRLGILRPFVLYERVG
jgi:hypothetical protein